MRAVGGFLVASGLRCEILESGGLCSHHGVMLRGGQIVNECSDWISELDSI